MIHGHHKTRGLEFQGNDEQSIQRINSGSEDKKEEKGFFKSDENKEDDLH